MKTNSLNDSVNAIRGITVSCSSHWNNSMYFNECSAVVYKDGAFTTVYVNPDSWYNFDTDTFIAETPKEIRDAYAAILAEAAAKKAAELSALREAEMAKTTSECQITPEQVEQIKCIYNRENQNLIFKLLATKKFRSEFRLSLANQIRKWLGEEKPKFSTPLSARQLSCLR